MGGHDVTSARLSRRRALRLAAGGAAGAAFAGAVGPGAFARALVQDGAVAQPAGAPIEIVPTGAQLPTEDVTFRFMARGLGPKGKFYEQFAPAYRTAHPNIAFEYEGLPPAELTELLSLGIQNGTAPDMFEEPDNIAGSQMVREGWVRPIDDLIPNFEAWKQTIPAGVLVEGVTMFGGKTYAFPYLSNKNYGTLLLYNAPYLAQAGVDPATGPLTWDAFRDAARRVTEQGQGDHFGYIIGGGEPGLWGSVVANLASMAGASGSGSGLNVVGSNVNWKTGQFNYTADQYRAAIELLIAMKEDGSVHPGSLQIDDPEARALIAQGQAGMILQGAWNIPTWAQQNPEFEFGVASQPVPNGSPPLPLGVGPGAWLPIYVSAESEHPAIAGDIFAYLASEPGQAALASVTKGFPLPLSQAVREEATGAGGLDPRMLRAYDLFAEQLRVMPDPRVRNPDVAQVYLEARPITPNFGQTVQGLYTGQLDDIGAALQAVQDRADQELERAIKAAQDKGAQVSRDDWVFPNWDPTRDYTDADYAAS